MKFRMPVARESPPAARTKSLTNDKTVIILLSLSLWFELDYKVYLTDNIDRV